MPPDPELLDEQACRERAFALWLDERDEAAMDRAVFAFCTRDPEEGDSPIDGPTLLFHGALGSFEVARETGLVVDFAAALAPLRISQWAADDTPLSDDERLQLAAEAAEIGLEEARQRAEDFAARHHPGFRVRNFQPLPDAGMRLLGDEASYSFGWCEEAKDGEVAVYPNVICVELHPVAAQVCAFSASDLVLAEYQPAEIPEEQARLQATACFQSSLDAGSVRLAREPQAGLTILPAPDRLSGRLVWSVRLELVGKTHSLRSVLLDARTGALLRKS